MNKIYLYFLTLFIPFQVFGQDIQPNDAITEIRETFTNFQSAIINNDKDWPKKFSDTNSIAYYDHLLYLIKEADSTQLVEENVSVILSVMYSRYISTKGKYTNITHWNDLVYYLNQSNFQKNLEDVVIKDIKVSDSSAIVYTALPENTEYIPYNFVLQNNSWKIYLISDFEDIEQVISSKEFQYKYGSIKSEVIDNIIIANGWNNNNKNLWLAQP